MQTYEAIGLMSGTSLDGLDIANCIFKFENNNWDFEISHCQTIPYDDFWKQRLAGAQHLNGFELTKLNAEYGDFLGRQTSIFIEKNQLNPILVASHGHTVFHAPDQGFTLQIGDGNHIRKHVKCMVINDFRSFDVAIGGQGAPLVPIGDELLFGEFDACINVGGFSNISIKEGNKRIAWDICPANIVLNSFAQKLGLEYDEGGKIARSGDRIESWFDELNNLDFYKTNHPKSLGREWVEENILPRIPNSEIKDLLRTFTEHVALQIAASVKHLSGRVLVTGGGAYNDFLVELIRNQVSCTIETPDKELIEFKEAMIFAFMGVLRMRGDANVLSSVTGAKEDSSSGVVWFE